MHYKMSKTKNFTEKNNFEDENCLITSFKILLDSGCGFVIFHKLIQILSVLL